MSLKSVGISNIQPLCENDEGLRTIEEKENREVSMRPIQLQVS